MHRAALLALVLVASPASAQTPAKIDAEPSATLPPRRVNWGFLGPGLASSSIGIATTAFGVWLWGIDAECVRTHVDPHGNPTDPPCTPAEWMAGTMSIVAGVGHLLVGVPMIVRGAIGDRTTRVDTKAGVGVELVVGPSFLGVTGTF